MNRHTAPVTSLVASPNGEWVASGSTDSQIVLMDSLGVLRIWESPKNDRKKDTVLALAVSPDSARLASSGDAGHIMIWDAGNGKLLATLTGHSQPIHTLDWSKDGSKLASGSDDGTVRIWDGQTYNCLHDIAGHPGACTTFVLFLHNGRRLASGGTDGICRLWNAESGALHKELKNHGAAVRCASLDPVDARIATASDDGIVRIWNIETGKELATLSAHDGPVRVLAYSPDGAQLVSGSTGPTANLKLFRGDLLSDAHREVRQLWGHTDRVHAASFSFDGTYVASASSDKSVRVWRTRDGKSVERFGYGDDGAATHVALFTSPHDGLTLASGSHRGVVRLRILRL